MRLHKLRRNVLGVLVLLCLVELPLAGREQLLSEQSSERPFVPASVLTRETKSDEISSKEVERLRRLLLSKSVKSGPPCVISPVFDAIAASPSDRPDATFPDLAASSDVVAIGNVVRIVPGWSQAYSQPAARVDVALTEVLLNKSGKPDPKIASLFQFTASFTIDSKLICAQDSQHFPVTVGDRLLIAASYYPRNSNQLTTGLDRVRKLVGNGLISYRVPYPREFLPKVRTVMRGLEQ